jgi:serine/threonine protein kinase
VQYDSSAYPGLREALCACAAVAKITDFGMATRINDQQSHMSGVRRGTPFYISPEARSRLCQWTSRSCDRA